MELLNVGLVIGTKSLWDEAQAALKEQSAQIVLEQPAMDDLARFLDQLRRVRPDVLILDAAAVLGNIEGAIRAIRSLDRPPVLAVVHTAADPHLILATMRAGANDFLYPPLAPGLRQALQNAAEDRSTTSIQSRGGGKIVGVLSAKGGCGVTTISCHLAVEIQKKTSRNVLLADFDIDAGLVGFLMKSNSPYTFVDAVQNVDRLDFSFWKALLSNGFPGIEILSAPASATARELVGGAELRRVMQFMRAHYDWTVIDLGRGLTSISLSALEEVDEVLLVTLLEVPCLHQAKRMIQNLLNAGFSRDRLRVVLNRTPKQSEITPEELQRMLGMPLYQLLPDDYTAVYEASSDRRLIGQDTRIGKHLSELASKITGVTGTPRRKFSLFG